jgi:hypothetical protein
MLVRCQIGRYNEIVSIAVRREIKTAKMQFFLLGRRRISEFMHKSIFFTTKVRDLENLREKACIFAGFYPKSGVLGEKNCIIAVFLLFITEKRVDIAVIGIL